MSLSDAISNVATASTAASGALDGLEKGLQNVGKSAENAELGISRFLKEIGNTKDIIRFEKSIIQVQRVTGQSLKSLRDLERGLRDISKGSTYSVQQLAKLTAELKTNMSMATMSSDAYLKLIDVMVSKFPLSAEKVLAAITELSKEFPSMAKAMKTGDEATIRITAAWNRASV
jgi:hypothetical protein